MAKKKIIKEIELEIQKYEDQNIDQNIEIKEEAKSKLENKKTITQTRKTKTPLQNNIKNKSKFLYFVIYNTNSIIVFCCLLYL